MQFQTFENLVDMQRTAVGLHGPRPALGMKKGGAWVWTSYNELGRRIDACRGGLAALGLRRGDAVAVISQNRVEWAVTAYATYGQGGCLVPMYETQLESDWAHIVRDSGARVLVVSTRDIYERVTRWKGDWASSLEVFCMDLSPGDDHSFATLEATGRDRPVKPVDLSPDDLCGLIYTSGTTGRPKGVELTHGNIISNVNAVHGMFPVEREDRSLSFLPWAHSLGQTCELHVLLSMGASIAVAESIAKLMDNFQEVRPTIIVSVPRIFNRIYDALNRRMEQEGGARKAMFQRALANEGRRRELAARGEYSAIAEAQHLLFDRLVFAPIRARFGGQLKYAFSGGAALSAEVADFIDRLGIEVYEGYGLTETSPICTCNRPGVRKLGSIGKTIPGVEVRVDPSGLEEDTDEGELVVYGPNVMKGYHGLPRETAEAFTPDGGFRTGDRGRVDADGFYYVTGRIKEQYKLENGKYVAPAPLEERIQLSPFISQVFIHGENKPFNVALVVPDREAILSWAKKEGIVGDYETVLGDQSTRDLIRMEIESHSRGIRGFERVKSFCLVGEEFTTDNGLLTPTLKIKRARVMERYGGLIGDLYRDADAPSASAARATAR
jgi:long-chain acyl-CoA synthetase